MTKKIEKYDKTSPLCCIDWRRRSITRLAEIEFCLDVR